MQARALWLVGTCGAELPQPSWTDAYQLAVQYMAVADLVVALQAVQAVLLLTVQILDDQTLLEQVGILFSDLYVDLSSSCWVLVWSSICVLWY